MTILFRPRLGPIRICQSSSNTQGLFLSIEAPTCSDLLPPPQLPRCSFRPMLYWPRGNIPTHPQLHLNLNVVQSCSPWRRLRPPLRTIILHTAKGHTQAVLYVAFHLGATPRSGSNSVSKRSGAIANVDHPKISRPSQGILWCSARRVPLLRCWTRT